MNDTVISPKLTLEESVAVLRRACAKYGDELPKDAFTQEEAESLVAHGLIENMAN